MTSLPIDPYPSIPTPGLAPNSAAPSGASSGLSFDDHLRSAPSTNEHESARHSDEPTARDIEDPASSGDLQEKSHPPTSYEVEGTTSDKADAPSPSDAAEGEGESDEFIQTSDGPEASNEINPALIATTDGEVEEGEGIPTEDIHSDAGGESEIDEQTSDKEGNDTERDPLAPAVLIDSSPVENRFEAQDIAPSEVGLTNEIESSEAGNSNEEGNDRPATPSSTDDSLAGVEEIPFDDIADSQPAELETTTKRGEVASDSDRPSTSSSSSEATPPLAALKTGAASSETEASREGDDRSPRPKESKPAQPTDTAPAASAGVPLPSGGGEIVETRAGENSARTEAPPVAQTTSVTDTNRTLQQRIVGIEAPSTQPDDLAPPERNRFLNRVARAFESASDRDGPIRLRLSPPELGSLRLEIQVEAGRLVARIETETTQARALLLDNLQGLRERLAEQNIRVDQFDVDLTDRQSTGSDMPQNDGSPLDEQGSGSHDRTPEETPETEEASSPTSDPSILLPDRVNVVI